MTESFLNPTRCRRFESIQAFLVPRARGFSAAERQRSRDLVETFLAPKPEAIHRKLGLFLFVIDLLSFFHGCSSFRNLNARRKQSVMQFLFKNPIGLLRKGFWGLNTICKLGVYGQTELYDELGYRVKPLEAAGMEGRSE